MFMLLRGIYSWLVKANAYVYEYMHVLIHDLVEASGISVYWLGSAPSMKAMHVI